MIRRTHRARAVLLLSILIAVLVGASMDSWSWTPAVAVLTGYVLAWPLSLLIRPVLRRRAASRSLPGLAGLAGLAPSNLPPPPTALAGRVAESQRLAAFLHLQDPSKERIAVVSGPSGIGRTALALSAAHAAGSEFTGGRLYGRYDPDSGHDSRTTELQRIQEGFLEALVGLDEASGAGTDIASRYRAAAEASLDERGPLLIVLDDAPDEKWARQLLPAHPCCLSIVTSVDAWEEDSDVLNLQLRGLDNRTARQLLAQFLGEDRLAADEETTSLLIRTASGSPLALQLTGVALASRPKARLDLAQLREVAGNPDDTTHQKVLGISFALLTPQERDAALSLGLRSNRKFAPWMIQALLGLTDEQVAWRLTDRLVDSRLAEQRSLDATGVPDLRLLDRVYKYVRQQSRFVIPEAEISRRMARLKAAEAARHEAVDWANRDADVYRALDSGRLSRAVRHARDSVRLAREPESPMVSAELMATAAMADLRAEVGAFRDAFDLLGTVEVGSRSGAGADLLRARTLRIRGRLHWRLRQHPLAVAVLEEARDLVSGCGSPERILVLREAVIAHALAGHQDRAEALLAEARRAAVEQPPVLTAQLAWAGSFLHFRRGHYDRARAELGGVLADRQLDSPLWSAWCAHQMAWSFYAEAVRRRKPVDHSAVLHHSQTAIQRFTTIRHRYGTAHCRLLIGRSMLRSEPPRPARAAAVLEEAVETLQNCDDAWLEAFASAQMARALTTGGVNRPVKETEENREQALALLKIARRVFQELGDARRAADVRKQSFGVALQEGGPLSRRAAALLAVESRVEF
ncbi:hypothetical protein [Cryptosporangium sp. NPDC051539]|uniref:hypothetical protein n=1 Tax=Cryptosporangium sp. NPDC051539 TaxID=3363962 RepID=UPI00379341D7